MRGLTNTLYWLLLLLLLNDTFPGISTGKRRTTALFNILTIIRQPLQDGTYLWYITTNRVHDKTFIDEWLGLELGVRFRARAGVRG